MNDWRELKTLQDVAEALKNGDEVEVSDDYVSWKLWFGKSWHFSARYRARPHQPKMKQIHLSAWLDDDGELRQVRDPAAVPKGWIRIPAEDKVIEIPE